MSNSEPTGTLILADETGRSLTWHHSVEFDGYIHTTACEREVECDDIRDVELEPREAWRKHVTPNNGCPTCHDSVRESPKVRTDGGQRQFVLRPCRSRTCDGKITMHTRPEDEDLSGWRCRECLTRFEAVQETLRTDGGRLTTPRRHDGPDGTLSSMLFQNQRRVFAYETHAAAEGVEERTLSVLWSYDRVEHPWIHGRRPVDLVERARGVLGR